MFGAGGAARACALALARAGAARIVVALREPVRASALIATLDGLDTAVEAVSFAEAARVAAGPDRERHPPGRARRGAAAAAARGLDRSPSICCTDPRARRCRRDVRDAGGVAFGGLGLLLHQAALSIELWTGQPAPLEAMSAAAIGAIGTGA